MKFKLSKVEDLREKVLNRADEVYAARYQEVLGPFAIVHQLKASGAIATDDFEDVTRKSQEELKEIESIERERMELKKRIRAATSTEELNGLLT